jgi:endonuclease/exonuclease/phosphatase (EEP) superfamily protein YafD
MIPYLFGPKMDNLNKRLLRIFCSSFVLISSAVLLVPLSGNNMLLFLEAPVVPLWGFVRLLGSGLNLALWGQSLNGTRNIPRDFRFVFCKRKGINTARKAARARMEIVQTWL